MCPSRGAVNAPLSFSKQVPSLSLNKVCWVKEQWSNWPWFPGRQVSGQGHKRMSPWSSTRSRSSFRYTMQHYLVLMEMNVMRQEYFVGPRVTKCMSDNAPACKCYEWLLKMYHVINYIILKSFNYNFQVKDFFKHIMNNLIIIIMQFGESWSHYY